MSLKIKKVYDDAELPVNVESGSIGYDLKSYDNLTIEPGTRRLVSTGLSMTFPDGYYGRIAPRSGLAWKKCVDIGAGVIDRSYRNIYMVLMINNGKEDFVVNKGDRIAQLILEKASVLPMEIVEELDETERGLGGFGSTGV